MNLVSLQNEEGLSVANKVTKRHVQYWENIMNVKLVTQTLCNSTTVALMYLENRNSLFKEAGSTAKYSKVVNDAFTILNVRSKLQYDGDFRRPLNEHSFQRLEKRVDKIVDYFKNLKTDDRTLIVESRQKCGFYGLICCLKNLFLLYEELKTKYNFQFLLTNYCRTT